MTQPKSSVVSQIEEVHITNQRGNSIINVCITKLVKYTHEIIKIIVKHTPHRPMQFRELKKTTIDLMGEMSLTLQHSLKLLSGTEKMATKVNKTSEWNK